MGSERRTAEKMPTPRPSNPPGSDPIHRRSVRQALRAWDNSVRLGSSPLARLEVVERRRQASGYRASPVGYGVALREVLQEALKQLMPDEATPHFLDRRWRPYLILTQQFLAGRSPGYLTEQMAIARSTYDHEQASALESLAGILRQWEQLGGEAGMPLREVGHAVPVVVPPPFLAPPKPLYPLVGRQPASFKAWLLSAAPSPVLAICGLPGVGKTALAIHLTHDEEVQSRFLDGILWAGLGRQPDVLALLGQWAMALGLSTEDIAGLSSCEDRARAVHAAIGRRAMLLILDDVWRAEEGLSFMLGGPRCAHVITSRLPKVGVELAGPGARSLSELDEAEGVELLTHFVPQLISPEGDVARQLVRAVGGLPLALTLMGRHLQQETYAGQPRRLKAALSRLTDAEERLRLGQIQSPLDRQPSLPSDIPLSLLAAIALSDEVLDGTARELLRRLSVFPPKPDSFGEAAAQAVGEAPPEALDSLVDCGLLETHGPGRYAIHRTVSEYAALQQQAPAAVRRFIEFYVHLFEVTREGDPDLDLEFNGLLAALALAGERDMDNAVVRGANAAYPYLEARGLYDQAGTLLRGAEASARRLSSSADLARLLAHLGRLAHRRGEYSLAKVHLGEGLALVDPSGDPDTHCALLQGIGALAYSRGDFARAAKHIEEGLSVARRSGLTSRLCALLSNQGALCFSQGDLAKAEGCFREGLRLARDLSDRGKIIALLTNLGVLMAQQRDFDATEAFLLEGLELARIAGFRGSLVSILTNLGTLASDRGDPAQSQASFREALSLARELNDRARVAQLLANLGALATARGEIANARTLLAEGLEIALEIGHPEHTCLVLVNLGALETEQADNRQAEEHFRQALALAEQMGHRRYIALVQSRLAGLSSRAAAKDHT